MRSSDEKSMSNMKRRALERIRARIAPQLALSRHGLAIYDYGGHSFTPALADLNGWWHKGRPREQGHRWETLTIMSLNNCLNINWKPYAPYSPLELLALEASQ